MGLALALNDPLYRDANERHASVECYDATLDTWQYVQQMSHARSGVGVGVMNGAMFAVGAYPKLK